MIYENVPSDAQGLKGATQAGIIHAGTAAAGLTAAALFKAGAALARLLDPTGYLSLGIMQDISPLTALTLATTATSLVVIAYSIGKLEGISSTARDIDDRRLPPMADFSAMLACQERLERDTRRGQGRLIGSLLATAAILAGCLAVKIAIG